MSRAERFAAGFVDRISTITVVGLFMLVPLAAMFCTEPVQRAVQFLSSSWAQLWFLPLIMLGQAVQGRLAEQRRSEIERKAMARHEAREARAAKHHDVLLAEIRAVLLRVESLCDNIAGCDR